MKITFSIDYNEALELIKINTLQDEMYNIYYYKNDKIYKNGLEQIFGLNEFVKYKIHKVQ